MFFLPANLRGIPRIFYFRKNPRIFSHIVRGFFKLMRGFLFKKKDKNQNSKPDFLKNEKKLPKFGEFQAFLTWEVFIGENTD